MKILKYLFFLILIFIIGGSIYLATKDGQYRLEESRLIKAPRELVFKEVNHFSNWKEWFPPLTSTKDMIVEYSDTTNSKGSIISWESDESGQDAVLKTLNTKPFSSIEQQLKLYLKFGTATSNLHWKFDKVEGGTRISVRVEGEESFKEKLAFLFEDESIPERMRPTFQKGLRKLNDLIINKMEEYSIHVDGITLHGGGFYMYTSSASKISQVPEKMQKMISDVSAYMDKNDIEKLGDPLVIYNKYNIQQGTAIFSAGFFTPTEVITPANSDILNGKMPNQKVLKTTLKGNYKNLNEAWKNAYKYLENNRMQAAENREAFEVYTTRPEKVKNPAQWITQLYIPLQNQENN